MTGIQGSGFVCTVLSISDLWTPSGSKIVSVDNSGNVGIGTTTPSQKLDVVGTVKATQFCIGSSCISSWPSGGGGGTITGVIAGTGLTGGGSSGSVTLNANTGVLQSRVSSSCASGSSIRAIAADGTVTCQAVGITSETDPTINTLVNGKWCTSDGTYVNCNGNAPASLPTCSNGQVLQMVSGSWSCGTIAAQPATYDSGWVYVEKDTGYLFNHNLGVLPKTAQVWFSPYSSGTQEVLMGYIALGSSSNWQGLAVDGCTTTSCYIYTGKSYVVSWDGAGTGAWSYTSGYARVILTA